MAKITFMGAGSTVFAKNVLGDCMLRESLQDAHSALYDVDATRLHESKRMLDTLNRNINQKRARITTHLGVASRKQALKDASYVVNAIQVGGYDPCTITDFSPLLLTTTPLRTLRLPRSTAVSAIYLASR